MAAMMMLGGRPDQCDHAAEDRGKAERHERQTGGAPRFACGLDINGHQQSEGGHVVHKG